MLKQENAIMKGHDFMRTAISKPSAALIEDIPIEYVQFVQKL